MRIEDPKLLTALRELDVECKPAVSLAELTYLGIGGTTDLLSIRRHEAIPDLLNLLDAQGIPHKFLGGGSNLLVIDGDLPFVVLQLASRDPDVVIEGNIASVDAAADLGRTVTFCAKHNLGGMEGLIGVPGTVGGALRMNAGAYGTEMGDVVRALTVFNGATGLMETVRTELVRFEYRHTSFSPHDVMLAVTLELLDCPYAVILERIKQCNLKRRASQPIQERSAGCIFKNSPGRSTGKMIDELGLKGTRVGGAVISERHANFIVNRDHATAADILKLMDFVRARVLKAYGLELEEEVIVWRA